MCRLDTHGKDRNVTGCQAPHQILEKPLAVAHTCAQKDGTSPLLRVVQLGLPPGFPSLQQSAYACCGCVIPARSELCQCLHRPRLLSCWPSGPKRRGWG